MNSNAAQRLIELNREFYTRFGAEFSATRQRLQPGARRVLESLRGDEQILDLGCGNGEVARVLNGRGHRGAYFGLDFSPPLLSAAASEFAFPAQFLPADLTAPNWAESFSASTFDVIFCFAALHHIPSQGLRVQLLSAAKHLLQENGKLILSNWQFLNSEKLRARIQPWGAANLAPSDVDAGDYLLDWRSGGRGLRYAHHFSSDELSALASEVGMRVKSEFLSDGAEGNLGLYQIWGIG
ncbi:MAG: class I SAM-dependent methyltransferase [Anaerolineales bacterium]